QVPKQEFKRVDARYCHVAILVTYSARLADLPMPSSFDRFLAQIVSPGLRQVAEHLHEARGNRLMPAWSAIDPSKIVRILPDIWAYSVDQTTGTFRAKLAGNNIVSRYAGHHAGKSIDELFSSPEREVIRTRFMRIATGPCFIRDYGPIY